MSIWTLLGQLQWVSEHCLVNSNEYLNIAWIWLIWKSISTWLGQAQGVFHSNSYRSYYYFLLAKIVLNHKFILTKCQITNSEVLFNVSLNHFSGVVVEGVFKPDLRWWLHTARLLCCDVGVKLMYFCVCFSCGHGCGGGWDTSRSSQPQPQPQKTYWHRPFSLRASLTKLTPRIRASSWDRTLPINVTLWKVPTASHNLCTSRESPTTVSINHDPSNQNRKAGLPSLRNTQPMSAHTSWWEALNFSMLPPMSLSQLKELQRDMLVNLTHHVNDPAFDLLRSPAWRGLVLALYVAVIIVGMAGNAIVIFVVFKNRNMQNVTNVLIANLALSDIGLCVFSLPIQLYYQLTDHWMFGELLCRFIFSAFAVPMYVSTLTILLIAYDRYWLIVYPLKERMSIRMALSLLAVTITTSVLLSVPVMSFTSLHQVDEPDLHIMRNYCVEIWPNYAARRTYSILMFTFQFCMPLFVTTLLYCRIYRQLKVRRLHRSTCTRKQKTNKILIAIVALFIMCWLPWNVFSLITELDQTVVRGPHFKFVDLLLKVFAMSSACVNPFLYCWLNDNFRKELDNIAVKLHVYREPSVRRHPYEQHLPVTGMDDNGLDTLDPYGTVTIDRFSSARPSTGNLLTTTSTVL